MSSSSLTTQRTLTLTLQQPSLINGEISHYQIAVVSLPSNQLPALSPDAAFPHLTSFISYEEAEKIFSITVAYIAAEFSADQFPFNNQFVIGNERLNDQPEKYTNGPLFEKHVFTFFLRAYPRMTEVIDKFHIIYPTHEVFGY